ncbi:MAG TPA: lysophospholipid acyltransferase family protein [Candidatus Angelobacter sp.]|nr:lysophospholipid acyltransferase family protein [Candidatus Angelobacter sp.]
MRTLLAGLFLLVAVPVGALIAFPWTFLSGKIGFLYWLGMNVTRIAVRLTGTRIEVLGMDNLDPQGTYIFMSNHISNLDPPILLPLIPRRTSVLVKKELWSIPIVAQAFDMAAFVPVERSNRQSAIQSVRRAGEVMRKGINMTVYPEGTRSRDGNLLPFKKGPFHLAKETGFSVVPVTMLGTREIMPKGGKLIKGGKVTVVFHPPIDSNVHSSSEELMQAVRDSIAAALPAQNAEAIETHAKS